MAAPSTTAIASPTGKRLKRGYKCVVMFSRDSTIGLYVIEVKPPGIDNGEPINITTMNNSAYMTKAEQALQEITDGSIVFAYDPNIYNEALAALIGQNGSVTVHYPDGSTLDFWGYLRNIDPSNIVRDGMPTASGTLVVTNRDTTDAEAGPVLTSVSGT